MWVLGGGAGTSGTYLKRAPRVEMASSRRVVYAQSANMACVSFDARHTRCEANPLPAQSRGFSQ
jgi:hypothetical protein